MLVSVVVPVYRSRATLASLHQRWSAVVAKESWAAELVLVDDSGDGSCWSEIMRLAALDERVRGIRLSRNFGQHNALLCGVRSARGDVIVTMDDDLQNPPEEIPRLLARLDEGFDLVYGVPARGRQALWRNLASVWAKRLIKRLLGATLAASSSSFRAFRSWLRDAFQEYRSPLVSFDVLLTWGTSSVGVLVVAQDERVHGRSGYSLGRLLEHTLNMVTGFSTRPLRLASMLGFVFSAFGLSVLVYVLLRYLIQGSSVPGFPFLASIIAIFSGAQLFALGIIGEYLARIHLRTIERPSYLIAESVDRGSPPGVRSIPEQDA